MDAIASNGWMIFRVELGIGIAGLLLVGTKAGQAVLSRLLDWFEMLADMDAHIAAKKAAKLTHGN